MRTSILLVAAVVLAGVVAMLVWFTSRGPEARPIERDVVITPPAPKRADAKLESPLTSADSARESVSTEKPKNNNSDSLSRTGSGTVSIQLKRSDGTSYEPSLVDLQVTSPLRSPPDIEAAGEGLYRARALESGTWYVSVRSLTVQTAQAQFEITDTVLAQSVELVLKEREVIRVRWRAPEGTPFTEAIAGSPFASPAFELAALVTEQPPRQDGMPVEAFALAEVRRSCAPEPRIRWIAGRSLESPDASLDKPAEARDAFAALSPDRSLPLFVSVWAGGVLMGLQQAQPGQSEVVFTTSLDQLDSGVGRVSVCVVDGASNAPIPRAHVLIPTRLESSDSLEFGGSDCLKDVPCSPVWTEISVRAEGFANHDQWVLVTSGSLTDLGEIRMTRPVRAMVRVVDSDGRSVGGVDLELDAVDSNEKLHTLGHNRVFRSNGQGEVSMSDLPRAAYVLRSIDEKLSALPVRLDARSGAPAEVVVHVVPAVSVAFLIDEMPSKGMTAFVETKDGLVVRVASVLDRTWTMRLAPGDYLLSFVESFSVTAKVPLVVGDKAFVFSIAR